MGTVGKIFSIPICRIDKEITLDENKYKNGGELLLIRDSRGNPVALLELLKEVVKPRVKIIFPTKE